MKRRIIFVLFLILIVFSCSVACAGNNGGTQSMVTDKKITFTIGERELSASLVENAATEVLAERLETGPITIEMNDYGGWEKVGSFGFSLPASNEQMTAQPCDYVLYQGNQLVIFYVSNSWSYTPLGRIDGVESAELKQILGSGDVTVTISLAGD